MVITGMNRFFAKHGRIAFFLIAIVISVAFVLFMTGQSIFDLFTQRGRGPATINLLGREVTQDQRIESVDRLLIQQALMYPAMNLENADYQKLDPMGINNLMLFYAAQDRGIAIGKEEMKKYIQSVPAFQNKGKFDTKKFNTFVDEKLKPRHFDKADLDEAIRSQLMVEKLNKDIIGNVIVPAEEIKEAFLNINEKAKVQTADFNASTYSKLVKVNDEEAESYYTANKEKYMTSPAVKIDAVRFEYGKFRQEAWDKITAEEVNNYYNDNKYLFVKKEVKSEIDKKEEKTANPKKVEYEPIEKVTDKIKAKLVEKNVRNLAAKAATKFSDAVYDLTKDVFYNIKDPVQAQQKCREIFANYAKNSKMKIFSTDWIFDDDTNINSLGIEPELVKAANDLFEDEPVSETIKGRNAAFVALLVAKKGPQPETFEKQKSRIIDDLKKSKSINLAREAARDAALKIGEALDKGQKFNDVIKKLKIQFQPVPQELSASMPLFMPNGHLIQQAAFETHQGQLAPVQNINNGALLVYVEEKSFPTDKDFEAQKAMFSMRYKMMKQQTVWVAFTRTLTAASVAPEKPPKDQ